MTTYSPTALGTALEPAETRERTPRLYRAYSLVYAGLAVLVLAFLALVPVVAAA
jgi:hypothetical protein